MDIKDNKQAKSSEAKNLFNLAIAELRKADTKSALKLLKKASQLGHKKARQCGELSVNSIRFSQLFSSSGFCLFGTFTANLFWISQQCTVNFNSVFITNRCI